MVRRGALLPFDPRSAKTNMKGRMHTDRHLVIQNGTTNGLAFGKPAAGNRSSIGGKKTSNLELYRKRSKLMRGAAWSLL